MSFKQRFKFNKLKGRTNDSKGQVGAKSTEVERILNKFVPKDPTFGYLDTTFKGSNTVDPALVAAYFDPRIVVAFGEKGLPSEWVDLVVYDRQMKIRTYPKIVVPLQLKDYEQQGRNEPDAVYAVKCKNIANHNDRVEKAREDVLLKHKQHVLAFYSLLAGQISPDFMAMLKLTDEGTEAIERRDPLLLIRAIRRTATGVTATEEPHVLKSRADTLIRSLRQMRHETLAAYLERFNQAWLNYQDCCANLKSLSAAQEADNESGRLMELSADMGLWDVACMFVEHLDTGRGHLVESQVYSEWQTKFLGGYYSDKMTEFFGDPPTPNKALDLKNISRCISREIVRRTANPTDNDRMRAGQASTREYAKTQSLRAASDAVGAFNIQLKKKAASGSVAGGSAAGGDKRGKKKQPCFAFIRGDCKYGDDCCYAHDNNDDATSVEVQSANGKNLKSGGDRKRQAEQQEEGDAFKRAKADANERTFTGKCLSCGKRGHKWHEGKCTEAIAHDEMGWDGQGQPPVTQPVDGSAASSGEED